jgi:hypothetical protein
MSHPITFSIWTSIIAGLRLFVRSQPSAVSLACDRCSFSIDVRVVDGMWSSNLVTDLNVGRSSRSSHALVLTEDGRLLISCEPLQFVGHLLTIRSGSSDGTFSTEKSSVRLQAIFPFTATGYSADGWIVYFENATEIYIGKDTTAKAVCAAIAESIFHQSRKDIARLEIGCVHHAEGARTFKYERQPNSSDRNALAQPSHASDALRTGGAVDDQSARYCGCDPGAGWTCEDHRKP